jgi:hypothetical protein
MQHPLILAASSSQAFPKNGVIGNFASANAMVSTSQSSERKPMLAGNYRPAPAPTLYDKAEMNRWKLNTGVFR